jgi:hypothetical protein
MSQNSFQKADVNFMSVGKILRGGVNQYFDLLTIFHFSFTEKS